MRSMILCLVLAAALPAAADSEESPLGLSVIETDDLELVYFDPTLDYLTPHAIRTFTNSLEWQRRVLGWDPYERTTVLLQDFSDYGNASAGAAPRNMLRFDIAPLSRTFETYPASERLYTLMNHELVHVATMDMWTEQDARWRRFFRGKMLPKADNPETLLYSYLTVPRFIVPRWYLEGSAVFLETWMSGGLGRAQGGYDEMVFRAMVRDNAHFYDPLGLVSRGVRVDFQVGVNAYLYGTRFMTWLAYAHTPEQVIDWLRRDENSERYFSTDFERVFGLPLDEAWQDWIEFEHDFQNANLEQVRRYPVTPTEPLVSSALGSVSKAFVDEEAGTLYGGFRYPGVVAHIGALDLEAGDIEVLSEIKGPMLYRVTSLAFDADNGVLFYTADNFSHRDIVAYDLEFGREEVLFEDMRIGDLAFNPADRSLWGVRHLNGLATIVRIPHPYTEWNRIHTFSYGVEPYDLDISSDGSLLSASVGEVNGDQFLRVWKIEDLREGNVDHRHEFEFGQAVPEGFVFSPDGRYLYGSSYYTGVSNIFRFELPSGEMEAVTNAETGFVRPIPLDDGRLVVFEYTGEGFTPVMVDPEPLEDLSAVTFLGAELAKEHPVVTTWQVDSPREVDSEQLITGEGDYVPYRNMQLQNSYPVLQGYKDSVGLGWTFNAADNLGLSSLNIAAAYTPDSSLPQNERGHVDLRYRFTTRDAMWRAGLSWNRSDFYDLFGPTKRSRKGFRASLGYDRSLIYDKPRRLDLVADIAFHDSIDTLPDFQNIDATIDRLTTGQVGLHYQNTRRSLGAVDDEKGVTWDLVASANHVSSSIIPQLRGGFDFGFALPLPHSSIWVRSAAGVSDGDRDNPFANYFFGGFGNNYVDKREIKRYRKPLSFPGFEIDEIGGRNFARSMIEWNLPPVVFERVGTPGFHLTWLRPAVFASALSIDPESSDHRSNFGSVGAQVDLRFTTLHWFDMTLSVGYAKGFRGSNRDGDEWMLSLKIM